MNLNLIPDFGPLMSLAVLAGLVLTVVVHIAFAFAVYRDAATTVQTRTVWFVSPFIWGVATLLGGVFVAGVFWALHYSTLRVREKAEAEEP